MDNENKGLPDSLPQDPEFTYNPSRAFSPDETHTAATFLSPDSKDFHDAPTNMAAPSADALPLAANSEEFQFVRLLGRGGFGEVWEAIQLKLRRAVAVKKLRRDKAELAAADSRESAEFDRSFREEAYTASQLDHPNIAPVYDLTEDESGSPLLAMKLIRGTPWNKLIARDFGELSAEDFLSRHIPILIDVSQAVAFAHSRGIAHRDLKPHQVVVGDYGEVQLLDWGLAVNFDEERLVSTVGKQALGAAPTPKDASSPAGTPAYMAPEQTQPTAANIGPWTDVYLLGGILFVLLTGRPPRKRNSGGAAFASASDGACDSFDDALPEGRRLPTDLAALCKRCMEPDWERRTVTAEEYVAVLEEHLSGARARTESQEITNAARERFEERAPSYKRFSEIGAELSRAQGLWPGNPDVAILNDELRSRFARAALARGDLVLAKVQAEGVSQQSRRNEALALVSAGESRARLRDRTRKIALAASGALILAVVGTVTVSRYQIALKAEAEAQARNQAEELVSFMVGDLRDRLSEIGRLPIMDSVADKTIAYYDGLDEGEMGSESLANKARSLEQIADLRLKQGDVPKARDLAMNALRILDSIPGPQTPEIQFKAALIHTLLAKCAAREGDIDRVKQSNETALALLVSAIENGFEETSAYTSLTSVWRQIASSRGDAGDREGEEQALNRAVETAEKRLALEPENPAAMIDGAGTIGDLVEFRISVGEYDKAVELSERSMELARRYAALGEGIDHYQREYAMTAIRYGDLLRRVNDPAGAADIYAEALEILDKRAELDPTNTDALHDVGVAASRLASAYGDDERIDEAIAAALKSSAALEIVAERLDYSPFALREFGAGWSRLATLYELSGDPELQLEAALKFRDAMKQASEADPGNVQWLRDLAIAYEKYGRALRDLGRTEEAVQEQLVRIDLARKVVELEPDNPTRLHELANSLNNMTSFYKDLGMSDEAIEVQSEVISIARDLVKVNPENATWQRSVGLHLAWMATLHKEFGHVDEAREYFDAAYEKFHAIAKTDSSQQALDALQVAAQRRSEWVAKHGDFPATVTTAKDLIETTEDMMGDDPDFYLLDDEAVAYGRMGTALYRQGLPVDGLAALDTAISKYLAMIKKSPDAVISYFQSSMVHRTRALIFIQLKQYDKADEALDASESHLEALSPKDPDGSILYMEWADIAILRSKIARGRGRTSDSEAALKEARTILFDSFPDAPEKTYTAMIRARLFLAEHDHERMFSGAEAAAVELARQAIQVMSKYVQDPAVEVEPRITCTMALLKAGAAENAKPESQRLYDDGYREPEFLEWARRLGSIPR